MACLLAGGGGAMFDKFVYPHSEVGGKLRPSKLDVSSIAPTATVSSAIGLYGSYACIVQNKRQ